MVDLDRSLVLAAAEAPLAQTVQGARSDYDVAQMYLEGLRSPRSRQTMREALGRIAAVMGAPGEKDAERIRHVAWTRLNFAANSIIRKKLMAARGPNLAPFAPATVTLTLASIRGVLGVAAKLGIITYDELRRATDWDRPRGFRLPAGRALEDAEVEAIRAWCLAQDPPFGSFALGVFAMLLRAGLRREELCVLPMVSYDDGALRVIGKGDKERLVPLPLIARSDVNAWIAERARIEMSGPWMFQRVYRDGRFRKRPLKPAGVWQLCTLVSEELGGEHFSPHDCRRTFVSGLLDRGIDLSIVRSDSDRGAHSRRARHVRGSRTSSVARRTIRPVRLLEHNATLFDKPRQGPRLSQSTWAPCR